MALARALVQAKWRSRGWLLEVRRRDAPGTDGAENRLTIVEIDRRVRQACSDIRGEDGTDDVSIYRLVSQVESVYCFLDAQRGVAHRKEYLS